MIKSNNKFTYKRSLQIFGMENAKVHVNFFVIIPVYNVENYIEECILSVLKQSYKNFRIILVDDGSKDNSGVICDKYSEIDPRVIALHQKNQGPYIARQTAIKYVKEKYCTEHSYFVFIDSDDTITEDALEIVNNNITRYECDLLIYGIKWLTKDGKTKIFDGESFEGVVSDKRELYKRVFFNSKYNSLCRKAIKCSLLTNANVDYYVDVKYAEDLLQSIPAYESCSNAVFIKDCLYNYRVNDTSSTHSISGDNYKVDNRTFKGIWDFVNTTTVLNQRDREEYKEYRRRILMGELIMISVFDCDNKKKISLFEQMQEDSYIKTLLEGDVHNFWVMLFKEKSYLMLITISKIRNIMAKIYHCFD